MILLNVFPPMNNGVLNEFSSIVVCIIVLFHCYKFRGKSDTIKIFVVGMIYGLVLENGGPMIIPELGLEGYFWEENYKIYLFEFFGYGFRLSKVPVATHLGWSMVFYLAIVFWERITSAYPVIKKKIIFSALIISSSGLLFDLAIDIIATRNNWWVWSENLLPIWFGVPLVNFIAWFWAVFIFGLFWVYIENRNDWHEKKKIKMLALFVPAMWLIDAACFSFSKYIFDLLGLIYVR